MNPGRRSRIQPAPRPRQTRCEEGWIRTILASSRGSAGESPPTWLARNGLESLANFVLAPPLRRGR